MGVFASLSWAHAIFNSFPNSFFFSFVFLQANHELALQDSAKKAYKQRGEIEEQIADMKVK